MKRFLVPVLALATFLLTVGTAAGHDHPAPGFAPSAPLSTTVNSSPLFAWELITTIPTGNPHTDLDFFTQGNEIYASVGTLGIGPNAGGQTFVKLTTGGDVLAPPNPGAPAFVAAHPSASCVSDPSRALGLQHDVEATPKGRAILNANNNFAVKTDAQLVIDATDAAGRCHDDGTLGLLGSPRGGLEIVDITNILDPVEIGLISHIGESHTVNIDPKRPHIAYSVTSDAIGVDTTGKRNNEIPGSGDRNDLDGWEVIDLRSCMNFPPMTTVAMKRLLCRPVVYRYRYPSAAIAIGHTQKVGGQALFGCHELEVYLNDRITCGSGNAMVVFDQTGAFDRKGTNLNFADDTPLGTPLPCKVRPSSSVLTPTGAAITDCVNGERNGQPQPLDIPGWIGIGSPSLTGVTHLGSAHHQGRGAGGPASAYDSEQDIDFNHEAEYTASRNFILASDERGGGVLPPGAACGTSPGTPGDNKIGNGGIHAYAVSRLDTSPPPQPRPSPAGNNDEAFDPYARTSTGAKAIYRASINTQPQPSLCTAHVFQQIPGQNRIFMGWYSQGTQVVDFVENANGTFEFSEAGYFIPQNANTWVSHIFKMQRNANACGTGCDTFTYWGATGDFNIGLAGRSAIDIYKVTLPAPQAAQARDPAVTLTKTGPTSSKRGTVYTYQLNYRNLGPHASQNAKVIDSLPAELRFFGASNGGRYDAATHRVTWNLGTVPNGGTGTLTLRAAISSSTPVNWAVINRADFTGDLTVSPPTAQSVTMVAP